MKQLPIGEVLRLVRVSRGLSQSQLGAKIKRPRTYISKLENGYVTPTLENLIYVCSGLEVDSWKVLKRAVRDMEASRWAA